MKSHEFTTNSRNIDQYDEYNQDNADRESKRTIKLRRLAAVGALAATGVMVFGLTQETDKNQNTPHENTSIASETSNETEVSSESKQRLLEDQVLIESGVDLPDNVQVNTVTIKNNIIQDAMNLAEGLNGDEELSPIQKAQITLTANNLIARARANGENGVSQEGDRKSLVTINYNSTEGQSTYIVTNELAMNTDELPHSISFN